MTPFASFPCSCCSRYLGTRHARFAVVLARLRSEFANVRVVVLPNYQGSEDICRAVRSGATAYLTKDANGDDLINAIRNVDRGLRFLLRMALDRLAERIHESDLTPRESEALACIAQGRANREIAEKTVRIHVPAVLDKLGARDRTQATIDAIQRGLVHLD